MSEHGGPVLAMYWLRDERNAIPPWRLEGYEAALADRWGGTFDWRGDYNMPTLEEVIYAAVRGYLPWPDDLLRWDAETALAESDSPFGRSWAECSALVFLGKEDLLYREDDEYRAALGIDADWPLGTPYLPPEWADGALWYGGDSDE